MSDQKERREVLDRIESQMAQALFNIGRKEVLKREIDQQIEALHETVRELEQQARSLRAETSG